MIHRVTVNINDPNYRKDEIIDDGKPWADDQLLAKYMARMVHDYTNTHVERAEVATQVKRGFI